jgi:hypothetical protein
MNYFAKGVLTATTLAALISLPIATQAAPAECDSEASHVKGVSLESIVGNTVDFQGSGAPGSLGPLLTTNIDVSKDSCLMAHFSAQVDVADNHVVFQVLLDDVPMLGHALFPADIIGPGFTTRVVFNAQMVAYNFTAPVSKGTHKVEIKFAGCCSTVPILNTSTILAAVLTLEYQSTAGGKKDDDDDDHHDNNYKKKYNDKNKRR